MTQRVVSIVGPTASGKTGLGIAIARRHAEAHAPDGGGDRGRHRVLDHVTMQGRRALCAEHRDQAGLHASGDRCAREHHHRGQGGRTDDRSQARARRSGLTPRKYASRSRHMSTMVRSIP